MTRTTKFFVTGATGNIGGCVISRLLEHPSISLLEITALVRTEEHADRVRKLGIKAVVGSCTADDLSFLTDCAAAADVVLEGEQTESLRAAKAILKGLKTRYDTTGKKPIILHTSGAAIFADDAQGESAQRNVCSDTDLDALSSLRPTAPHKEVDDCLILADEEGYVKTYLIAPGAIFGRPSRRVIPKSGGQKLLTNTVSFIVRTAVDRKAPPVFGKGMNSWCYVHIDDVSDFYIFLLDTLFSLYSDMPGHGKQGYYFLSAFSLGCTPIAEAVGDELVKAGYIASRDIVPYTNEELRKIGPEWRLLSANCCTKGDRARELGWKPRNAVASLYANIRVEVTRALQAALKT